VAVPDLTLYQFTTCPYCARVRKVLAELGLKYEKVSFDHAPKVEIDGLGETTVPALRDGDRIMNESGDIIDYLYANYGPGAGGIAA
jgi:glutathione S-transferase